MGNNIKKEDLIRKIKVLNDTIWEDRIRKSAIDNWLNNFKGEVGSIEDERLHALYLLSEFMYFGHPQIREGLKAIFRDLFKYPIIEAKRKENEDTTDIVLLNKLFEKELMKSRFLGVGNPSESGCHLMYYFRQENNLPKSLFIHGHQIFERIPSEKKLILKNKEVLRYVFIDDFCGSGTQCLDYLGNMVQQIHDLDKKINICYYSLFGCLEGEKKISDSKLFDSVNSIFLLDDSYKIFEADSLVFNKSPDNIDMEFSNKMCKHYGELLWSSHPLGYKNNQLLIGFHHNTPNNTLPIMWAGETAWSPIFKRYDKIYYGDNNE